MKTKSTSEIFRLLFKLLYYFIIDRTYFKKLILHSGREIWYLIVIVILSGMIASLIGQLTVTKLNKTEDIFCESYQDVINPLQDEISKLKAEVNNKNQCLGNDPDPKKPKAPIWVLPPKSNDRKEHDIEQLLEKIK